MQVEGLRNGDNEHEVNQDDQPDIKGEDNAIEMCDNFDGKLHDMETRGKILILFINCYTVYYEKSLVTDI